MLPLEKQNKVVDFSTALSHITDFESLIRSEVISMDWILIDCRDSSKVPKNRMNTRKTRNCLEEKLLVSWFRDNGTFLNFWWWRDDRGMYGRYNLTYQIINHVVRPEWQCIEPAALAVDSNYYGSGCYEKSKILREAICWIHRRCNGHWILCNAGEICEKTARKLIRENRVKHFHKGEKANERTQSILGISVYWTFEMASAAFPYVKAVDWWF